VTIQPGLPRYDAAADCPALVWAAVEASRRLGCDRACLPETGRLLRVLAAGRRRIGETGTACGVGAAWLASGMAGDALLVTVERDERLAAAAAAVLGDRAKVVTGDWTEIRPHGPFDLLFCDGGPEKGDPAPILELVVPGGLVVLDDLTPEELWGDELRAALPAGDPVRLAWSRCDDATATELLVSPADAVLVVSRAARTPAA
jgi:predicted O-methyltransferase YrrM